jgi:hypothetical protein
MLTYACTLLIELRWLSTLIIAHSLDTLCIVDSYSELSGEAATLGLAWRMLLSLLRVRCRRDLGDGFTQDLLHYESVLIHIGLLRAEKSGLDLAALGALHGQRLLLALFTLGYLLTSLL